MMQYRTRQYKVADLIVDMACSGQTLLEQGEPYLSNTGSHGDIALNINREKFEKNKAKHPELSLNELEYIFTGFAFSHALLDYNGFCLHSSAVAIDNKAILFSAPCGTGKSTHAGLWQKHFGRDRVVIINDDKPAIRLIDDAFYVYGTPWSGKTGLNMNLKVPLQAVVFIEQAEKNHIRLLNNREAVQMLVYQSMRPNDDREKLSRLLALIDALLKKIPVYKLGCTISIDAVRLVYETIL
ncbi:MAG TPA: hypothetical protein PK733_06995 [Clostridiales bacterium]|nr:hypothetical protein [Clostridiales bacterium]